MFTAKHLKEGHVITSTCKHGSITYTASLFYTDPNGGYKVVLRAEEVGEQPRPILNIGYPTFQRAADYFSNVLTDIKRDWYVNWYE